MWDFVQVRYAIIDPYQTKFGLGRVLYPFSRSVCVGGAGLLFGRDLPAHAQSEARRSGSRRRRRARLAWPDLGTAEGEATPTAPAEATPTRSRRPRPRMEALRAAGRAVLRSPSLARHRLGVARLRRPRPQRLLTAESREPPVLLEGGVGFALKYLGMTLVGEPKGEQMAAAAVRRILAMTRVGPKKFRKVVLTVSPRGLSLQDAETQEPIESISIYRISYCTTDKLQNKVFAYVAQNPRSGALECHAFLSPKKKVAQAVTLTVAQAFQVALDLWEAAQAGSRGEEEEEEEEEGGVLQGERGPHSSMVLCPTEGACCRPSGSPPFKANFEEEEEDDDEDDDEEGDLNDNLSRWGAPGLQQLPGHHPLPAILGGLELQPPQQLPAARDPLLRPHLHRQPPPTSHYPLCPPSPIQGPCPPPCLHPQ
ncbi:protein FAM43B isoform X2 [Anolis carolinensis]|uniref:protein FAM43B isoform X2 n=1 Tax=Anolis carolinensis TaxID=28377 RepID=UPI002F2B8277